MIPFDDCRQKSRKKIGGTVTNASEVSPMQEPSRKKIALISFWALLKREAQDRTSVGKVPSGGRCVAKSFTSSNSEKS